MGAARTQVSAELEAFNAALDDFLRASRRQRGRLAAQPRAAGELSLSQYHVLEPLAVAAAPLGAGELAERAGVSPPSVTRMLDGLERDGLVARERRGEDRRVVHVRLTEAGRRKVADKRRRIAARRAEVFAGLPPAERRRAARVLSHLAAAIEELR